MNWNRSGTTFRYVELFPAPFVADADGDGIADAADNCTKVANAAQHDTNENGFGNACDADLSDDCVINVVDLGLLRTAFFATGPGRGDELSLTARRRLNPISLRARYSE